MRFSTLYRLSFYVMLILATWTLNVDAGRDFPLSPLYPIAVAIACIVAFFTVDRNPALGLPADLAKLLAVGSVALSMLEWWWDENLLVLAMGHWLVYLQLIKILLPKTVEDDWFLYLLALTQVVVGAFLPGENVGFMLVAWSVVALWTLSLFYLQREAAPAAGEDAAIRVSPAPDPREPYPGLIDGPFVISGVNVALLTLALGGLIFLLMPRWGIASRPVGQPPGVTQNLTGFSDRVQLGQMGQILESEELVMSIELYNAEERRIRAEPESLWRGVVMLEYDRGSWSRQGEDLLEIDKALPGGVLPQRYVRQEIKLEPTSSDVLFAQRPVLSASGPNVSFNRGNGALQRRDLRGPRSIRGVRSRVEAFDYTVISGINPRAPQPGEAYPSDDLIDSALLDIPRDPTLRRALDEIRDRVLADIPADQVEQRAVALESHLRDSGIFAYSLSMNVVDASIDPIADFLLNRRVGHCEYYASALTMLLRSAGIPARMVNGFKGGDWNALGQVLMVRQKHAHSWVEALVGRGTRGEDRVYPLWLTLDPTPALEREESVARVGGFSGNFRYLSDYLRYLWIFYVVGFNEQRQQEMIYAPIRELVREARAGFQVMATWPRLLLSRLLDFPDVRSFFSLQGFVVSVLTLLLLAGLYGLGRWILRRTFFRGRRAGDHGDDSGAGIVAYRRLMSLLSDLGLHRPPAETPLEFSRRARDVLHARGPEAAGLADLPAAVIAAFYGLRFGDHALEPEASSELEARLDALETTLRPPRGFEKT